MPTSPALAKHIDQMVQQYLQTKTAQPGAELPSGTLQVVDLGGGTGAQAARLAGEGHHVTVVDPSPDALAAVARRASEAGLDTLHAQQGDAESLPQLLGARSVDLVLCHGVLEVVDDPAVALHRVQLVLRPRGRLSLLVASLHAAVLLRVVKGHLRQAHQLATSADGRWGEGDPLRRRFTPGGVADLLAQTGFDQHGIVGIRTFSELVSQTDDEHDPQLLEELDQYATTQPALLEISSMLHIHAASASNSSSATGDPAT